MSDTYDHDVVDDGCCQNHETYVQMETIDYNILIETLFFNLTGRTLQKPDDLAMSKTGQTLLTVFFTINIILSIVGNILVILVLTCVSRIWTDLTSYLVNLSVADLTMAVFCMPFTFPTIFAGHWKFGKVMCPTVIFLQQVSVIVSVYTLTAIGIDRYYAILHPLTKRVTKNRTKHVICIIWVVSICLSIVQLVSARSIPYDLNEDYDIEGDTVYFCGEWLDPKTAGGYEVFVLIITYIIPLCILTYTYVNIGKRLWGRTLPGNIDRNRDLAHLKAKRKTIKMLVIVVLMFALCWLPLHVINVVMRIYPDIYVLEETQGTIRILHASFLWLACANSFVNPFVYVFINETFQTDLKRLLKCQGIRKWRRKHGSIMSASSRGNRSSTSSTRTRLSLVFSTSLKKSPSKKSTTSHKEHLNDDEDQAFRNNDVEKAIADNEFATTNFNEHDVVVSKA
ncbi:prolactin-releasing peptide receptor-like [Glandiceps talaboti]